MGTKVYNYILSASILICIIGVPILYIITGFLKEEPVNVENLLEETVEGSDYQAHFSEPELTQVTEEPLPPPLNCPVVFGDSIRIPELRNGRRVSAGPILMGMHSEGVIDRRQANSMVEALTREGVQYVLSFHPPDTDFVNAADAAGLIFLHDLHTTNNRTFWNFHWFRGYDPSFHDTLMGIVNEHGIHSLAIHCQHGVDRTGNAMAYLLAVHCDVPIADAFYMVVNSRQADIDGLNSVLAEFGITDTRDLDDPLVGLYTLNGQGMKAHTSGFRTYIRETILQIQLQQSILTSTENEAHEE